MAEIRFVAQAAAASQKALMKLMPQWQPAPCFQPHLLHQALAPQHALSHVKMLLLTGCFSKAPFIARLLVALDQGACLSRCSRMAHAIISRVLTGFCKDAQAALASFQAAHPEVIMHDGFQYKTLFDHNPHLDYPHLVGECYNRRRLDPGWHICPNTPDTVRVCAAYPWQAGTLVFADGSGIRTGACAGDDDAGNTVNTEVLIQEDGLFGTDWYMDPDAHYDMWSALNQSSDVFIRRKL
jgi:hypothetical protein